MDAKKYFGQWAKVRTTVQLMEEYHQAKSKEEAQERYEMASKHFDDLEKWSLPDVLLTIELAAFGEKDLLHTPTKSKEPTSREAAMKWWNNLSIDSKMIWTNIQFTGRSYKYLSVSMIEQIFKDSQKQ